MTGAPFPADEAARVAALAELGILDSGPDDEFDALVAAASSVCGMPISLISLIDESRQWFKANKGLPGVAETPREQAFCGYTILGDDILEVPDATADSRFSENPLVTGAPGIRFYAGAPLRLRNGQRAGSLCVIGTAPARLTDTQRDVLRNLGRAAAAALEGWAAHRRLAETQRALAEERQRLVYLIEGTGVATWELNLQTGELRTNDRWRQLLGCEIRDLAHWRALYHPEDLSRADEAMHRHLAGHTDRYIAESRMRHSDGQWLWVLGQGAVMVRSADGAPAWVFGWSKDITERKQQEEALRRSERLLQETGQVAGVGGWTIDLATQELHMSAVTVQTFGLPPGTQLTIEEAISFYAPEARPVIAAALAKAAASGGPYDLELRFIRADGQPRWTRSVGSAVFGNGKPVRLVGAFQDVTDQVSERMALIKARERLALATDSGRIGVWEWDIRGDVLVWDDWMYRLYRVERDETKEKFALWTSSLHPADREKAEATIMRAVEGAGGFDTEFRIVGEDGEVRTIQASGLVVRDGDGAPLRMIGTNRDVTDERRLADTLAAHDELLQVTLASIGDAVITADTAGQVVWLNPVAERLTGWTTHEAAGRTMPEVFDIVDEDTRVARQDLVAACLKRGEPVELPSRTMLISRSGEEYGIKDSVAPIKGKNGEVHGVVIVFHDETRERRLEAERETRLRELSAANAELDRFARHLARARAIAEQANRAKTRFIAGMSHELRTPLNGILGYAQLLRIDGGLTATQSERVHAMMTAGTHLLEMIHCVLDLSEIETGGDVVQTAETDLRQLAEAALEMVRPGASAKRLALGLSVEPAVPRLVISDAKRLRQVLLNLLGNAVKFTPSGRVDVRIGLADAGTRLRFEVADTGPGVPPDKRHRLFAAFDRLDSGATASIEGAGLGLSLAAKFAKLMGGGLGYNDNPGGGSLFWLEVPLEAASPPAAESAVTPAAEAAGEEPAASGALPILVVDDIAMNRDIAAAFLQSAGYEIACAESGEEAVLAASEKDWLAVLMDVRMPGMGGLEATRQIRALPSARALVPVIALTAQAFTDDIEKCRAAGMDSHVAKPFTFEGLLEAVRRGVNAGHIRRDSPAANEPGAELAILDAEALGRTAAVLPPASIEAYLRTLIDKGDALQRALNRHDGSAADASKLADAAHALAGSAGMFGFDRLVFVARRFEREIKADPSQVAALAAGLHTTLASSLKTMRGRVASPV